MSDTTDAVDGRASPFQGLAPFVERDSRWFFGRDEEIERITDYLKYSRINLLVGRSGIGKTSLLRGGIVPSIRNQGFEMREENASSYAVCTLADWSSAFDAGDVAVEIVRCLKEAGWPTPKLDFDDDHVLVRLVETITGAFPLTLLVILDQFEEFLEAPIDSREGRELAARLSAVMSHDGLSANFLIAIRDERLAYLDKLQQQPRNLYEGQLSVGLLSEAATREAIIRPLDLWSQLTKQEVRASPGLIDTVLKELGDRSGLPHSHSANGEQGVDPTLLQILLQQVWDRAPKATPGKPRVLDLQTLPGGAARVLDRHVEAAVSRLNVQDQSVAAAFLDKLVTLQGAGTTADYGDALLRLNERSTVDLPQFDRIIKALAHPLHPIVEVEEAGRSRLSARISLFHDALGSAVRNWTSKQYRIAQGERDRQRRWFLIGLIPLILSLGTLMTLFAGRFFLLVPAGLAAVGGLALVIRIITTPIQHTEGITRWGAIGMGSVAFVLMILGYISVHVDEDLRFSFVGEGVRKPPAQPRGATIEDGLAIFFPDVPVGETRDQTFNIRNPFDVDIDVSMTLADSRFRLVSSDCPLSDVARDRNESSVLVRTLEPNGVCSVTARFSPRDAGLVSASVNATVRAGRDSEIEMVSVVGVGLLPDVLALPRTLDFGTIPIGLESNERVTVHNAGDASANFSEVSIDGHSSFRLAANECADELPPGADCTVTVRFSPQVVGDLTAVLSIAADQADRTSSIDLSGSGTLESLTISPQTLEFPTTAIGSSRTLSLRVANVGTTDARFGLGLQHTEGALDGVFALSTNCPTQRLEEDAACDVTIGFAPLDATSYAAVLQVTLGSLVREVPLAGEGGHPVLLPSPTTLEFAATPEVSSLLWEVQITNAGTPTAAFVEASLVDGAVATLTNVDVAESCNELETSEVCRVSGVLAMGSERPFVDAISLSFAGGRVVSVPLLVFDDGS